MSTSLKRYARPVAAGELGRVLEGSLTLEAESIGTVVDLSEVREIYEDAVARYSGRGNAERAVLDRELVEPLHRAMRHLSRRDAADMRLWHWLCTAELPDLVSWRWYGSENIPREDLTQSLAGRFIGSGTLNGVSRNALARLWWCAESLYSELDGYRLAREALKIQDRFQAIFERYFGLYPPAARACIRQYESASQKDWRDGTLRLNHYLTTIVLETLSEDDVTELLAG